MKSARLAFFLAAVLLLTPCIASYAYGFSNDALGQGTAHAEAAEPGKAPGLTLFAKAIGGVSPGDLFYIDTTKDTQDFAVNLYLTNAYELITCLRYLILKVGIYFKSDDGLRQEALMRDGSPIPDTFITLHDSLASFMLAGGLKYTVTIDSGSFYCITTGAGGGSPSPQFYLTAEPL